MLLEAAQPRPRISVPLVAAILGALVGGLVVRSAFQTESTSSPVARVTVTLPAGYPLSIANQNRDVLLTPDGTKLVYFVGSSNKQLYVRPLSELEGAPISDANQWFEPFASPDGTWIGFVDEGTAELKKMSIFGGAPETICGVPSGQIRGASWGPDATIVFGTLGDHGLWRVPADGGEPELLAAPDSERSQAHS